MDRNSGCLPVCGAPAGGGAWTLHLLVMQSGLAALVVGEMGRMIHMRCDGERIGPAPLCWLPQAQCKERGHLTGAKRRWREPGS